MLNAYILKHEELDSTAKLVWHVIQENHRNQSSRTIATATGLSIWAARKAILRLEKAGLLCALTPIMSVDAHETVCVDAQNERPRSQTKKSVNAQNERQRSLASVADIEGGEGETPRTHAGAPVIPINNHIHTRTHSNINTHSHSHMARKKPDFTRFQTAAYAEVPESVRYDATFPVHIGTILHQILECVPDQQKQLDSLAKEITGWIKDPETNQSIPRRIAEAVLLQQLDWVKFAKVIQKVNRMAAKGNVKSRGALCLSLLKKHGFSLKAED